MKIKKIISLITVALLVFQGTAFMAFNSFASDYPGKITVESAVVKAGETVSIDITVEHNPGINAMTITPVYDASVLMLNSMTAGEGIWKNCQIDNRYVWANMSGDSMETGTVLTLNFTVLESASAGSYPISVLFDNSNINEQSSEFRIIEGEISVVTENSGMLTAIVPKHSYVGQTVEIPVILEKNPGVSALKIDPVFDESVFEFIEIRGGEGKFANATILSSYVWANMGGDYTEDDTVCTIVLKVRDTAPHADTIVSVNLNSSNWNETSPDIFPIANTTSIHNDFDIVTDEAVKVTCTTDGYTEGSHCSVCGDVIVARQVIPAPGHDFEEKFTVDLTATTTAVGQKSRHCKNCDGITDVTEIPMVQRDINDDGNVNSKDLTRLMKSIAGQDVETTNTDVTGDGETDARDLTRLMKYLAGNAM